MYGIKYQGLATNKLIQHVVQDTLGDDPREDENIVKSQPATLHDSQEQAILWECRRSRAARREWKRIGEPAMEKRLGSKRRRSTGKQMDANAAAAVIRKAKSDDSVPAAQKNPSDDDKDDESSAADPSEQGSSDGEDQIRELAIAKSLLQAPAGKLSGKTGALKLLGETARGGHSLYLNEKGEEVEAKGSTVPVLTSATGSPNNEALGALVRLSIFKEKGYIRVQQVKENKWVLLVCCSWGSDEVKKLQLVEILQYLWDRAVKDSQCTKETLVRMRNELLQGSRVAGRSSTLEEEGQDLHAFIKSWP